MFKFIISQHDLEEVTRNTEEVYKGLWLSKLPSEGITIGYGIVNGTVVVKFEENDGERLSVEELHRELGHEVRLPSVYGSILSMHKATQIGILDRRIGASVHINRPDGQYLTEYRSGDWDVIHHAMQGDVFVLRDDTYVPIGADQIKGLIEYHTVYDIGMFIDREYEIRFKKGSSWVYFPMRYVFHSDLVATTLSKFGDAELWANKQRELLAKFCPTNEEEGVSP